MNSVLQIQSDNLNLPLSLFISAASDAVDQQAKLSRNILKFYNLVDLNRVNHQSSANRIELQTKRILDYFNCIRFRQPMLGRQSRLPNQNYMQQPQHHQQLIDSKTKIPSFSFILITNNSNTSGSTNIANTNPSNKLGLSEEDYLNGDLKNLWSYHHKVELNDPVTGKPIARQLFYRLNTFSNFELPLLFSKSNWHSPMACNTSNDQQQQSVSSVKYIVRLNINCKNFEMMLFFYRMLFNKCANHSKKHFSLFVLKTIRENDSNNNKCEFEYQLSLKYHDTSSVSIANANSSGSVNEDHLIYKVDDRSNFEHICRLLSGYTTELIKDKVYAVQDPDGNQIYLVDSTTSVMNCSSKISASTASSLFCSIGISERYFNSLKLNNYSIWLPQSNLKVMNTNSSSSSFQSADSGNYSTLSSSSSSSNVIKCANYSNNIGKNVNIKSNETVSAGPPTPQNVPVYHSSKSNRLAKSLREYQEFMKHYKKLHKLISKEQICLQNEEAKIKFGVKDLIQRFNCNKDSMSETSSGGRSSSSAGKNKSCENIKNIANTSASDEYELKDLMRKATLNPIDLIHFKNKEVNVERQINAINNCRNMKGRSLSVMAEPYRNRKNNSFSSSTLSSSVLSSSSSSSLSTLSSMSSDSINIKLKVFDRQKSKSVTFIDSNIKQNEKLKHKKLRNKQALHNKSAVQQRERSKSTIPFSELEHRHDFYNSNCYLTADVDNESEYYTINEPNNQQYEQQLANTNRLPAKHINYLSNEFNLIAFKSNKNNSNQKIMNNNVNKNVLSSHRPQVGVTPETRFRRAPTLDIIRSTKMPVQQTNENIFSCNQQKFFFNNLQFKTKPKQAIAKF